jgi:hypothetical protein
MRRSASRSRVLDTIAVSGAVFLFVLVASTLTFRLKMRDAPTVFDLHFGFGDLVHSLHHGVGYMSAGGFWTGHRMPLIPYLLTVLSWISTDSRFVLVAKNLAVFSISGLALFGVWRQLNGKARLGFYGLLVYLCSFPHLVFYSAMLDTEEGYLIHFLALLASSLLFFDDLELHTRWARLTPLALLNAGLFLTKSSMLAVSLVLCLAFYLRSERDARVLALFLATLTCALAVWGTMNWIHSSHWTISSSWNGWNLFKGNNPHALRLYPSYCLDILDNSGLIPAAPTTYLNEWAANQAYLAKAVHYIKAQPVETLALVCRKTWVLFFEIRKIPISYSLNQAPLPSLPDLLSTPHLLVFRILLLIAVGRALWSLKEIALRRRPVAQGAVLNAAGFLALVLAYAAPYVIGFAYTRHVSPLVVPTGLFLLKLTQENQPSQEVLTSAYGQVAFDEGQMSLLIHRYTPPIMSTSPRLRRTL